MSNGSTQITENEVIKADFSWIVKNPYFAKSTTNFQFKVSTSKESKIVKTAKCFFGLGPDGSKFKFGVSVGESHEPNFHAVFHVSLVDRKATKVFGARDFQLHFFSGGVRSSTIEWEICDMHDIHKYLDNGSATVKCEVVVKVSSCNCCDS